MSSLQARVTKLEVKNGARSWCQLCGLICAIFGWSSEKAKHPAHTLEEIVYASFEGAAPLPPRDIPARVPRVEPAPQATAQVEEQPPPYRPLRPHASPAARAAAPPATEEPVNVVARHETAWDWAERTRGRFRAGD